MSFTSMHNDHLDPDRHLNEEEPPCDRCKWDVNDNCVLTTRCQFEEKSGLPPPSSLTKQVGGNHYKDMEIQPVEFITRNNLNFLEGSIIKRICRYKRKGGAQDLDKIIHEATMLKEMIYGL